MKKKNLFAIAAILFASMLMISCSKDNRSIQPNKPAVTSGVVSDFGPVYSSGIMGRLAPAPFSAAIKVYIENKNSYAVKVNPDGSFKSGYIEPGVYKMQIAYLTANSGFDTKWLYFDVNKVEVFADGYTDLGAITLP